MHQPTRQGFARQPALNVVFLFNYSINPVGPLSRYLGLGSRLDQILIRRTNSHISDLAEVHRANPYACIIQTRTRQLTHTPPSQSTIRPRLVSPGISTPRLETVCCSSWLASSTPTPRSPAFSAYPIIGIHLIILGQVALHLAGSTRHLHQPL